MIIQKDGKFYMDIYLHGQRVRKSLKGCSNKKTAEAYEAKRLHEAFETGEVEMRKNLRITFENFSETYLKEYAEVKKESNSCDTDIHILKSLNAFFGKKLLGEISSTDVNSYIAFRKQEVSRITKKPIALTTINRCLTLLKTIFNFALQYKKNNMNILFGENPVKGVKFFDEPKRIRFLSHAEVDKLCGALSGEALTLVLIALNTGLRKGELKKLTWGDINFSTNMIAVGNRHDWKTKSGKPRFVPMTPQIIELLQKMPAYGQLSLSEELVFAHTHRKHFEAALETAGIKDFKFHDLRHTFASYFMMNGGNIYSLMEILGHASLEMTKRYAHLSPSHLQQEMQNMVPFWSQMTTEQIVSKIKNDVTPILEIG